MSIPVGLGGGVENRSEGGPSGPSLVRLIATLGPATDAPNEGSGSAPSWGRARLQYMSGSLAGLIHLGTVASEKGVARWGSR